MKKYLASSIAVLDNEWLWENLRGEFILVFEDGEIQTNWKETIYSAYAWRAFHVQYPLTPYLKKHHVQTIIKDGKLGSRTHLDLLGSCMWSCHEAYIDNPLVSRDSLAELIYKTMNVMYNELSIRLEEYVLSIDITDFLEITNHPSVKETLDNPQANREYISKAVTDLKKLLSDEVELSSNPISKAYKSNLVNKDQVLQCVGPIGYRTDIDSVVFPVPVAVGFVKGTRLLHDSLIESRSAAKSLYFSKDPLQDAEYFSRRLQLLCQIVENLHTGPAGNKNIHNSDCGSKEYLIWKVKPPRYEFDKQIYEGDLPHLEGKFYLDENTNKLLSIKSNDTHLNGKTIRLRSVVAGCCHPDPHGVCAVCFGELSYSVPENTNLGHMCSTSMTQKTSQAVLGTKHSDTNLTVESIMLSTEAKWFLKTDETQSSYLINNNKENTGMKIKFHSSKSIGLTDVNIVNNIEDLSITRVSEIDYVGFVTNDKGASEPTVTPIMVSINNRLASLTHDFLAHVKKVGWIIDTEGNYVIDLTGWDYNKTFLTLPQKHFNMSAHSSEIAAIIESRVADLTERDQTATPIATLVELFDLVNSKLDVNLAVLEVVLYAAMIVSAERDDYRLPKPWTDKGLGVTSVTIPKRSLAIAYAYEYHRQTIVNPSSFFNENRESHLMDAFICPREVVEDLESIK